MKIFLFLAITLYSQGLSAQVVTTSFSEKEKKCFALLKQVVTFLNSQPAKTLGFHEGEFYSKEEAFYDTVINKFFAKEKMLKEFARDTMVFAVIGKLDITRHVLNSCDYYLDLMPPDSIIIERDKSLNNAANNADKDLNIGGISLSVYFKIDNKKIEMLVCNFDGGSSKLLGFSILSMQKEDSESLFRFLTSRKNYYPHPNFQQKPG